MKAKKENKVYTIDDTAKESFLKQGFDIISDDGKLIQHAPSAAISHAQYEALQKENDCLKKEIEALKKQTPKKSNKGKENDVQVPEDDKQPEGMPEE